MAREPLPPPEDFPHLIDYGVVGVLVLLLMLGQGQKEKAAEAASALC